MVAAEFDEQIEPFTDGVLRERLYRSIVERVRLIPPAPNPVRREDLMGGLAAGWLVFACSFPSRPAIPGPRRAAPGAADFQRDPARLLFFVGWRMARHTLARPWIVGATFLMVGLLLVLIAIPLGG